MIHDHYTKYADKTFTEHDFVRRFPVHVLGFQSTVEQLDVAAAAVDALFVFDRVLDDQVLTVVGERLEFPGQRVETEVLRRLDALVGLGVVVNSARAADEPAELFAGVFRVRPLGFPGVCGRTKKQKLNRKKKPN